MSKLEEMAWATEFPSPTCKFVAITLARHAWKTGRVFPSYRTVAEETGLSRRTIIDTMDKLEAGGFLKRIARLRENGSASSNEVIMTLGPVVLEIDDEKPDMWGGGENSAPPLVQHLHQGGAKSAPPEAENLNSSLSLGMIREISGDALADPAKSLGVASYHLLTGIMTGDRPCSLDDIKAGLAQAAAWYRGKRGPGSMSNYDLAAKLATEARDARLAGAPPVTEGRTHGQPAYTPAAKRAARDEQNARSFAVAQSVIERRARGSGG